MSFLKDQMRKYSNKKGLIYYSQTPKKIIIPEKVFNSHQKKIQDRFKEFCKRKNIELEIVIH